MAVQKRYSKKREAIYNALTATHEHPSAEWLYQQLKPQYPDLSLATVYRNLKEMVAQGDAIIVGTVDGKERFDSCHRHPHAHLLCKGCGCVVDVEMKQGLEDQCHNMESEYAFNIDPYGVHFTGLCKDCMSA
jgi:Fur family peroxide stress response transcriptional regulator